MEENNKLHIDPIFDPRRAGECVLSMQLSPDGLTYCIFNRSRNQMLGMETISFNRTFRGTILAANLKEIIHSREILQLSWGRSMLLMEGKDFTLVPSALYSEKDNSLFVEFNYPHHEEGLVKADRLKNMDAYNVFLVMQEIVAIMEKEMPACSVHHHNSAFIESLLLLYRNTAPAQTVFVNIRAQCFDAAIISNQRMVFFNTFSFRTSGDFIYYLMFVYQQLKLNPENDPVRLCGAIESTGEIFDSIVKYIRNISFVSRTDAMKYSYVLDDISPHRCFSLFNSVLCGL